MGTRVTAMPRSARRFDVHVVCTGSAAGPPASTPWDWAKDSRQPFVNTIIEQTHQTARAPSAVACIALRAKIQKRDPDRSLQLLQCAAGRRALCHRQATEALAVILHGNGVPSNGACGGKPKPEPSTPVSKAQPIDQAGSFRPQTILLEVLRSVAAAESGSLPGGFQLLSGRQAGSWVRWFRA